MLLHSFKSWCSSHTQISCFKSKWHNYCTFLWTYSYSTNLHSLKEKNVQVYASINQLKINQLKVACSSSVNERHNWNRCHYNAGQFELCKIQINVFLTVYMLEECDEACLVDSGMDNCNHKQMNVQFWSASGKVCSPIQAANTANFPS